MEVYKEVEIKHFSKIGISILILLPFLAYYMVHFVNQREALTALILAIVVIIIPLIINCFDYKKAIITCINDTLNIQFIKQNDTEEYIVNLLAITEYKEMLYPHGQGFGMLGRVGSLVFIDTNLYVATVPYKYAYKDVRKEILNVLQNYNIKKTLVF